MPSRTLSGTEFGIDFNPLADRLRVVSDTGQNLRIDVDSGATITDTALTAAAAPVPASMARLHERVRGRLPHDGSTTSIRPPTSC